MNIKINNFFMVMIFDFMAMFTEAIPMDIPQIYVNNTKRRIIGGEDLSPYSYPFIVGLNIRHIDNSIDFCGGTLLDRRWILTAAHCVYAKTKKIEAFLGAHDLSNSVSSQKVEVASSIIHRNWSPKTFQNDIALLKLSTKVTFSETIQPVIFASDGDYIGKIGTTIGWGITESGQFSSILKSMNSPIISNQECSEIFENIGPKHICISGEGNKAICNGDSGGPLIVDSMQVGIVSFRASNCSSPSPSCFTKIILGLLTNFSTIAPSMSIGFSAIAIPVLEKEFSNSQISWFASIASLATPAGCIFSGPFADRFGRKLAISLVNVACFIGWTSIAAAFYMTNHNFFLLIFGRIFTGLSTGLCSSPATIYMAEIASPSLRGVFTVWATLFFSFGVLVIYFLGFLFKENLLMISLITAALPCIGIIITVIYIPESPMWLLCKNRIDEARSNMYKIVGSRKYNLTVELALESHLKSNGGIVIEEEESAAKLITKKIKYLLQPYILKPLLIIIAFFFFQQLSGIFVILFYAVDIVKKAQITFDAYTTIVIIALVRLVACIVASIASKKFGRRPLSMISGICMAISLLALVGYIQMKENGVVPSTYTNVVPYILIMLYFFTSCIGFLPFPFALSAEMFPTEIKGLAAGLCSSLGYVFNFAAVKIYPMMEELMGAKCVFLFYGVIAFIGTAFLCWFLPETRGRSVDEIQVYFGKTEQDEEKCDAEKCVT